MKRFGIAEYQSPGLILMALLCVVSVVCLRNGSRADKAEARFWIYADSKEKVYRTAANDWNREHPDRISVRQVGNFAIMQRMRSEFFSGTPMADIIELHPLMMMGVFNGPLEAVGFTDFTEILRDEGLYDHFNASSFAPWTSRGRVFGIPVDVGPVILAYRADIVEAAGIDMEALETWDDFFRVLRPLVKDLDGDGYTDRFLLEMEANNTGTLVEVLILQAGGRYFDAREEPVIDSPLNARVIANIALWGARPDPLTTDVFLWSPSNSRLLVEGHIVAWLNPDWRNRVIKLHMPSLAGKVKFIPLPAWQQGGRRTSVYGSSMVGIPKSSPHFDTAWSFVKTMRFSEEFNRRMYREAEVVSPLKTFWDDPVYDEPDPFFCGQSKGRIYAQQAPYLPQQTSSPFNREAREAVHAAMISLRAHTEKRGLTTVDAMIPQARALLREAEAQVRARMRHNTFLREPG